MHDTISVDPFLAEQVDERWILDADGAPDEPCVERFGARYAPLCEHAQQRTRSFRIRRFGFPPLKPVVQGVGRVTRRTRAIWDLLSDNAACTRGFARRTTTSSPCGS